MCRSVWFYQRNIIHRSGTLYAMKDKQEKFEINTRFDLVASVVTSVLV